MDILIAIRFIQNHPALRSLQIIINWVCSFIIKQPNRVRNPLLMLYKSAKKNTVLYLLAEEDLHLI